MADSASHLLCRRRPRRDVSCFSTVSDGFFSSGGGLRPRAIILFLSIVVVILIPSLFSSCVIRFRPRFMKTVWDALTVMLILFAVICGFLAQIYENADDGTKNPCCSISCVRGGWTQRCRSLSEDLSLASRSHGSGDSRTLSDESLVDPLLSLSSFSPQPSSSCQFVHQDSAAERNFQSLVDTEKTDERTELLQTPSSYRMEQSSADKKNSGDDKDSSTSSPQLDQKKKKKKATNSKTATGNDSCIASARIPLPPPKATSPSPTRRPSSVFLRLFSDKKGATRSKKRVHSLHMPPLPSSLSSDAMKRLHLSASSLFSPPPPQKPPSDLPQLEEEEMSQSRKEQSPAFCPSPDVNSKADAFIANLRAGWQREKLNSIEEE